MHGLAWLETGSKGEGESQSEARQSEASQGEARQSESKTERKQKGERSCRTF
jgi:hypothetical protein